MDRQDADRMVNNLESDLGLHCLHDLSVWNHRKITVFVSISFQFKWKFLHANSEDPDQMAQNAASNRGVYGFPKP